MVTSFLRAGALILALAVFLGWPAAGHGAKTSGAGKDAKPATAAKPGAEGQEKETPLHITSARMEADQDQHLIIFTGQVKAVHGDSTLYCDQLLVYYKPTEPSQEGPKKKGAPPEKSAAPPEKQETSPLTEMGGEKIDRIVAKGHVRLVQEDKLAVGEEGIYYRDKEMVELRGNPQVWRGENNLKGDKIYYYLKTKRVLVEGSPRQRVEAHLYQAEGKGTATKEFLPGSAPKPAKRPKH